MPRTLIRRYSSQHITMRTSRQSGSHSKESLGARVARSFHTIFFCSRNSETRPCEREVIRAIVRSPAGRAKERKASLISTARVSLFALSDIAGEMPNNALSLRACRAHNKKKRYDKAKDEKRNQIIFVKQRRNRMARGKAIMRFH